MYFKRYSKLIESSFFYGLFFILFFNLGCDLKLNEAPPPQEEIVFSAGQKVLCLTQTMPYFKSFFKGEPEGERANEFWNCAQVAVKTFKDKSISSKPNQYTATSLAHFLEKYFLENKKIDQKLINEVMLFKQLLLGGSDKYFTQEELSEIIHILSRIEVHSPNLFPYMKIYRDEWTDNNLEFFESSKKVLLDFALEFASWIHSDGPNYELNHFVTLIQEFESFTDETSELAVQLNLYLPALKKLKKVLNGGDEEFVTPHEWKDFLKLGSRAYLLILRFDYFIDLEENVEKDQILMIAKSFNEGLQLIEEMLKEKQLATISNQEIVEVLEKLKNIFPNINFSNTLITQFMKLKKSFIGGSEKYWSVDDFIKVREKIDLLSDIIIKNLPYYDLYLQDWDFKDPQIKTILNDSKYILLQSFSVLVEKWNSEFDFKVLYEVINEIAILYPNFDTIQKLNSNWKIYYPIFESYNNLIVGKKFTQFIPKDWQIFISQTIHLYYFYLEYFYTIKKTNITVLNNSDLEIYNSWIFRFTNQISNMIESRTIQIWDFELLNKILIHAYQTKLLPQSWTLKSYVMALDLLLNKYLNPSLNPTYSLLFNNKNQSGGLTVAHLNILLQRWLDWYKVQKFNNDFTKSLNLQNNGTLFLLTDFQQKISFFYDDWKNINNNSSAVGHQLALILSSQNSLVDPGNYILQQGYPRTLTIEFKQNQLLWLNTIRNLIDLAMNVYKGEAEYYLPAKYISVSQFKLFLDEFAPLMLELGWLDDYKQDTAEKRFLEANLFTPTGNGDDRLEFMEAVEYLQMILSASARKANFENIYLTKKIKYFTLDSVRTDSDSKFEIFINENFDINYQLYLNTLLDSNNRKIIFDGMPSFLTYFDKLTFKEQNHYLQNVDKGADLIISNGKFNSNDLVFITSVIQYIESLIIQYDFDQNGYLNTKESLAAFPRFKNKLESISKIKNNDTRIRAIFTYILKYGVVPDTSFWGKIEFLQWESNPEDWNLKVTRLQFSKILAMIQSQPKN